MHGRQTVLCKKRLQNRFAIFQVCFYGLQESPRPAPRLWRASRPLQSLARLILAVIFCGIIRLIFCNVKLLITARTLLTIFLEKNKVQPGCGMNSVFGIGRNDKVSLSVMRNDESRYASVNTYAKSVYPPPPPPHTHPPHTHTIYIYIYIIDHRL
jgi:hypothetical protein